MLTTPFRWVCLVLIALATTNTFATDLLIKKLVLPPPTIQLGMPVKIEFVVANVNVLAALEYNINVVVRNSTSGTIVFNETVAGIPIEPNTEVTHSTEQLWTPLLAGAYDIGLVVNFADDINPSNNASLFPVVVSGKPNFTLAAYYLMWRTMYANSFFGDAAFDLVINQPSNRWRYANVVMSLAQQQAAVWILQNILIPPWLSTSPYTVTTRGDLSALIPNTTTTPPEDILVELSLTDTPITDRTDLPEYATIQIGYKPRYLDLSYGLKDLINVGYNTAAPVSTTAARGLKDTVYRGCTVPNMDLDSSKNNPTTVPGYAGDMNACAPTAAANSMQWLEDSNPNIKSGLTHRKKLEALSKAMKRSNNEGVWIEDFIKGKLEYIAEHNLPISVKFQVRGLTKDVINFPESDYDAKATNKGDGGYPKFDFVKKEMADSEDVETFVEYHDPDGDSSKVVGRHVITCTGAASDSAGNNTFWYKDDGDQRNAGGTSETTGGWVVFNDSVPYIESYLLADGKRRITVPYGVVSESYDPSVKQTEKGFFENLRDAAAGIAGRYEHGRDPVDWKKSHPIRFMHLFRRARGGVVLGGTPGSELILQNMPIGDVFGVGTYTFIDPSAITISVTDSTEVRVQYSDKPLTSAPDFDGSYRTYPVANITAPSFDGALSDSIEPSLDGSTAAVMPMPDGLDYLVTTNHQPSFDNPDGLDIVNETNQGASSIWGLAAMLQQIDNDRTEVTLTSDIRDQLLTQTQFDKTKHGVTRSSLFSGLVAAIDDQRAPVSGRFQCVYQRTGNVASPRPFGHVLTNESNSTAGVTWEWLTDHIQRGPLLVEIGIYSSTVRIGGMWVLVTGIVEHNGLRRILSVVDVNEASQGGLRNAVGTVGTSDNILYIAEWSRATMRAQIVSAVSLEYDPTLTFTGVADTKVINAFDVTVAPQPATEQLHITWTQPRSDNAHVALVDLTGRTLLETSRTSASRMFTWDVNVQDFASGQYRLIITSNGTSTSVPVIIIH